MSETLGLSLREAIYSRITESDGCYLLIYSGSGEKLAFLSYLCRESRNETLKRLLVDLSPKQLCRKMKAERLITIDSLPSTTDCETPESYCLREVRREVANLGGDGDSERLALIVDASSFILDRTESKKHEDLAFHKRLAFHKEIVELAKSKRGISAVLLYDASFLTEKFMSELIKLHEPPESSTSGLTPKKLKEESLKRISAGKCYRGIVASQLGVMLLDPVSQSVALLLPMTDAIQTVLPNDPLNIGHRDVAFANGYTSNVGACPYRSSDVTSGCLLDPNVVHAVDTRGQSFVEGYPCVTAVDHMIFDEKAEKNEDSGSNSKMDETNRSGKLDCVNDPSDILTAENIPMPAKHVSRNQRLKATTCCKTTGILG
jgi:hypothetical protein